MRANRVRALVGVVCVLLGRPVVAQVTTGGWPVGLTPPVFIQPAGAADLAGCATANTVLAGGKPPTCTATPTVTTVTAGTVNATTTYQLNGTAGVGFALAQAQPGNATARSSSGSFVMMGLGADATHPCTITPTSTGRVVFTITGDVVNNTTATTISLQLAESTGVAPANNAAATGTVISQAKVFDGLTTDLTSGFSLTATQTGLALGTAVWFDLQLQTSSTNTGQPTNLDCVAFEL